MTHHPTFSANVPSDTSDHASTHYEYLALTEGLTFRHNSGWVLKQTSALSAVPWPILVAAIFANGYEQRLYRHPSGALVLIGQDRLKSITAYASAKNAEAALSALLNLKELLPERPPLSDKEEVNVDFWSLGANGTARSLERSIAITPWERVRSNYTSGTQGSLEKLMVGFKPSKAGQLILWYGPPGTGKTHALRALAWEWRKWCSCHYITDPEVFFGGNANYMLDVLLLRATQSPGGMYDDEEDGPSTKPPSDWRLLILEDSGELMGMDAKATTGQGLSRLLNVVDGLIGQGLRIMVLVTTNEVLKKLHPAVARPGRCAARIEFAEFKKEDAAKWLEDKHVLPLTGDLSSPLVSLADLYSRVGDEQVAHETKSKPLGFS